MKKILVFALLSVIVSSLSFSWFWDSSYEKQQKQIKAFVMEADAYIKKNGQDVAFKEFQKKDGKFFRGELYIFVVNFEGNAVVHPANPKLIGKKLINLKDVKKKLFVREYIKVAKSKEGEGWVDYYWTHPVSKKIQPKLSFVKNYNDEYMLIAGLYAKK